MEKKIFIMIITILALSIFQLFNVRVSNTTEIDFSLYETVNNEPTGTPTESGTMHIIPTFPPLGEASERGYAILLESGPSTNADNWSDVVIIDKGYFNTAQPQAQLLSDLNEGPNPNWPALAQVMAAPHLFVQETSPPTSFSWTLYPTTNFIVNFHVYSDAPEAAPVPEPATMVLLGSGLIGLAGYGKKKFF